MPISDSLANSMSYQPWQFANLISQRVLIYISFTMCEVEPHLPIFKSHFCFLPGKLFVHVLCTFSSFNPFLLSF